MRFGKVILMREIGVVEELLMLKLLRAWFG